MTRCYWCPSYEACLDIACKRGWNGMTCAACPVYVRFFDQWTRIVRKVSDP